MSPTVRTVFDQLGLELAVENERFNYEHLLYTLRALLG